MAAKFIIDQIIVRHRCPQFIKTDNGTNFSSGLFQKLLEYMHICGVFTAPYHPSSNGTVKRVNQTLANILCKISDTHVSKWPLFLPVSIFAYNISTHLSTGYSPFEMLYRCKPALPPVLYLLVSNQKAVSPRLYLSRLTTALIKLHTNAYVSAEKRQINSHTASKYCIKPNHVFSVDDQVLNLSQPSGSRLFKLDSI